MSAVESNGLNVSGSTLSAQEQQAHEESLKQWNVPLQELYRYCLSFLKDKEGSKALRLSYNDKIKIVAYQRQITHGPFRAESARDCGFFDVVGNDRKKAWSELGELPRSVCMLELVKLVHLHCPLLKIYVEAQTVNRDNYNSNSVSNSHHSVKSSNQQQSLNVACNDSLNLENHSADSFNHSHSSPQTMPQVGGATINESETDFQSRAVDTLSNDLQKLKLEEEQLRSQQEAQIRTLLNQQTAIQFRQYAQEQHPNDVKKQEDLVRQLQQQHFQQYMTQVLKQQIEHQKQQARQIAALLRQQRKQQLETAGDAAGRAGETEGQQGGLQIVDEGNDDGSAPRAIPSNGAHALSHIANAAAGNNSGGQLAIPRNADDAESNVDDSDADGELSDDESDAGKRTKRMNAKTNARATSSLGGAKHDTHVTDADANTHQHGSRSHGHGHGHNHNRPAVKRPVTIEQARMWTRKDVREFKSRMQSDRMASFKIPNKDNLIVRVPTHPDGTCIFWEFATDNYDIGFGVYFEWNLNPGDKITVHISESDDEDPEDEDAPPPNPEGKDPERGKKKKENEEPTDEIIPVYRRDSHEEVYCGSHTYPGKGVYLLKFDNSYSLWRSKWVYYRVYYGK